jgi:hypothetical protein
MGIYDRVEFDEDLDPEFPGFDGDPSEIVWQTKTLQKHPLLENFRVSDEGRLLKEEVEYEEVPGEERGSSEVLPDLDLPKRRKVHLGWSDIEYQGVFKFHSIIDDEYTSFEARFTDGNLVKITRSDRS